MFRGEKSLGFEFIELTDPPPYFPNFLGKLDCKNSIEEEYIKKIYNDFKKGKTKVYLLVAPTDKSDEILGFVALSASRLDKLPAVLIDYIYIRPQDRKKIFEIAEVGQIKLSRLLIDFAIKCTLEVKSIVGVDILILEPADTKLIAVYEELGFTQIRKSSWMHLKVGKL